MHLLSILVDETHNDSNQKGLFTQCLRVGLELFGFVLHSYLLVLCSAITTLSVPAKFLVSFGDFQVQPHRSSMGFLILHSNSIIKRGSFPHYEIKERVST